MNKNEKLLEKLGLIDEKYVEEAKIKMKRATAHTHTAFIGAVICFFIMIGIGLYLFIPFKPPTTDLSMYAGSEYFPIIEKIAEYRYVPNKYKNNFEKITDRIKNFGFTLSKDDAGADNAAPEGGGASNGTGNYVEATDNQVSGVIEADIIKRTDKYIFRLGMDDNGHYSLKVYSIEKDNSKLVTTYNIPKLEDERYNYITDIEMYLSTDAKTVTIIKEYRTNSSQKVSLISIDVSDVSSITEKSRITLDGAYNSSRLKDGRILLITEFYAHAGSMDYSNPETFVPKITRNGESKCVEFEDIIYPEKLENLRYSVVTLFDEDSLDLLGANALLSFGGTVYVSENNVYAINPHSEKVENERGYTITDMTDIAIIGYSDGKLSKDGIVTVEGAVKNQYSLDEYEGHLRVVTSTYTLSVSDENGISSAGAKRNANMYVISLDSKETVAEVIAFAPMGESAESVRFDGDKAYVCTAIVVTFSDPVYFFDLSDYENITYTDTGDIDGFSSSLINLKDGFLLGIGQEDARTVKVEVYEELNGEVVSVDAFTVYGSYSIDYKSYLVNREENLFGFGFYSMSGNSKYEYGKYYYVLLHFDGYKLNVLSSTELQDSPDRMRGVFQDGYLYITTDIELVPVKIFEEA